MKIKTRIIPPLERGENKITSSDAIADQYANIPRDSYKKCKSWIHRKRKKGENLPYNKLFTDRTENIHKTTKNTASEEDTIHLQMIKKSITRNTEVPARHV